MRLGLRMLATAAFLAGALSTLAFAILEGPVGVVLPLEQIGLGCAAAGVSMGGIALWAGLGRRPRVVVVATISVLLSAVSGGLTTTETILAYQKLPVTFVSGDITLAGDLYAPRGASGAPAAVLVHGSGRETRREYAFYARFLARRGIAALAYDKRGTGQSQGNTYTVGYDGYANDAARALQLLRETAGVDRSRVGFVGFSEAEWVAPLASSQGPGPAFLVVVGAGGLTPAQQVVEEVELRLLRKGFSKQEREDARALYIALLQYQRSGELPDGLRAKLKEATGRPWFRAAEDLPAEIYPAEDYRWWRGVMDFDAAPLLAKLACPMLFIKGELDDRSEAEHSQQRVLAAVGGDAHPRAQFQVYPGADHSILLWPRGAGVPPPAFPDGYPERIASWILQKASPAPSKTGGAYKP